MEAIEEYLDTAKDCLVFRKPDGGCRGYPDALLLLCTLDVLGRFAKDEIVPVDGNQQKIGDASFRVLNHPTWFGQSLSDAEMKRIKDAFRHTLAHNALLIAMAYLNGEPHQQAFAFYRDAVEIRLIPFHELLRNAWAKFDKSLIPTWVMKNPKLVLPLAKTPMLPTPTAIVASSGCP